MTTADGLRYRNKILVFSSVANLALSLVLAQWVGLVGPAIAAAFAGVSVLLVCINALHRRPQVFTGP